jgi:hypothetical protein
MCEGGSNVKVCKRVSDVLQESDYINTENKKECLKKHSNSYCDCSFYECMYFKDECCKEEIKEIRKCKKEKECLEKENKTLKDMVEAISLTALEKPVKIISECIIKKTNTNHTNTCTKSKNKKYIPLNKYVKVCVYNANIRKKPDCHAKILKIVKKGTKLYAIALVNNAWIKLKNGYIHKSLICGLCKEEK